MERLQVWYYLFRGTVRRLREKFWMWLAWCLPAELVRWAAIRLVAHATMGKFSHTDATKLTAMDAMQRWDDSAGGDKSGGGGGRLKFKRVMRYEPAQRKFRLFRLMWAKGEVGKGGYSAKLAVSFWPKLFHFERDFNEWRLTILGISVHRKLSYGGIFV